MIAKQPIHPVNHPNGVGGRATLYPARRGVAVRTVVKNFQSCSPPQIRGALRTALPYPRRLVGFRNPPAHD
jgi:hypothetical protein